MKRKGQQPCRPRLWAGEPPEPSFADAWDAFLADGVFAAPLASFLSGLMIHTGGSLRRPLSPCHGSHSKAVGKLTRGLRVSPEPPEGTFVKS